MELLSVARSHRVGCRCYRWNAVLVGSVSLSGKCADAKSGEYEGCRIPQIDLETRNCFTFNAQWAGALSCNKQPAVFPELLVLWHSACAFTNVPSLLTNSDCSLWGLQKNKLAVDNSDSIEIKWSTWSWHAVFATWLSYAGENSFHVILCFVVSFRDRVEHTNVHHRSQFFTTLHGLGQQTRWNWGNI